jgi:hypothetical protein
MLTEKIKFFGQVKGWHEPNNENTLNFFLINQTQKENQEKNDWKKSQMNKNCVSIFPKMKLYSTTMYF